MSRLTLLVALFCVGISHAAENDAAFQAGFGKADVTPTQPVRLSGYANRAVPYAGVQTPLWTRAMAMKSGDEPPFILFSLDTIGTDDQFADDLAQCLNQAHGIPRERIAIACSHSHTAPHLAGGITNLFETPLSAIEQANMEAYTEQIKVAMLQAADTAIDDFAPAMLSLGQGRVGFAINRRAVTDGVYQGFGIIPEGAVDHTVDLLRIDSPDGTLRGVVFNYACHATTLTGNENVVNGDWPGYVAADLEDALPGVTALCTIGCGADANPEPRGGPHPEEHAQAHGRALALEAQRLLKQELTPLTTAPTATYGHADLPIDQPTQQDLEAQSQSANVQEARRANQLLSELKQGDPIAASYPMPIHVWRFGDQLTMVFLGGEVVVDYVHRLRKELPGDHIWVTAYANDVFGYLASERVRSEGGYEVDHSQIFYNQPGRWSTGTEDLVIEKVKDLAARK